MTTDLKGAIIDAATCRRVCLALAKRYGGKLLYGPDSAMTSALGMALQAIGVTSKADFVKSVSVTVNDSIYLPFHPGAKTPSLASQVATVAHECEHLSQSGEDGLTKFWANYFCSEAHRTGYETKALAVTMEVLWRLTGRMPSVITLAASLRWYKVSPADIRVAEKHLASVADTLKKGGQVARQIKVIEREVTR